MRMWRSVIQCGTRFEDERTVGESSVGRTSTVEALVSMLHHVKVVEVFEVGLRPIVGGHVPIGSEDKDSQHARD